MEGKEWGGGKNNRIKAGNQFRATNWSRLVCKRHWMRFEGEKGSTAGMLGEAVLGLGGCQGEKAVSWVQVGSIAAEVNATWRDMMDIREVSWGAGSWKYLKVQKRNLCWVQECTGGVRRENSMSSQSMVQGDLYTLLFQESFSPFYKYIHNLRQQYKYPHEFVATYKCFSFLLNLRSQNQKAVYVASFHTAAALSWTGRLHANKSCRGQKRAPGMSGLNG